MATRKQVAEAAFNDLVNDGQATPEGYVLDVMRGKRAVNRKNKHRYEAAIALLPYRLPRLNSIDATTKNVSLTHEEWIAQMEGEGEE